MLAIFRPFLPLSNSQVSNRSEVQAMQKKVTKAIFPVAGLGPRFLPATKAIPKEIMTLVDKPLIQYAIDEARAAGIKEFIFVTSRGKGALEDYFDHSPQLEDVCRKAYQKDYTVFGYGPLFAP